MNAAKCLLGLRRGKVLGTDLVAHNLVVHNLAQPSARPSGAQLRLKKRRRADFPAGFKTHTVRESLADSI